MRNEHVVADYSLHCIHKVLKALAQGEPCEIICADYRESGKGQTTARALMLGVRSGRVHEIILRSADSLEAADLLEVEMQLL